MGAGVRAPRALYARDPAPPPARVGRTLCAMEDGPEEAEGRYEYGGKTYRLEEQESEKWRVYDGDRYLGQVLLVQSQSEAGFQYTIDLATEEGKVDEPATDDWQRALETLIDLSAPPVGG
jgi:hypothetical protein